MRLEMGTANWALCAAAIACTSALIGCTVGPDYKGPPDAAPIAEKAATFHRAGDAPVTAIDPPARWWEALNDALLTHLIETAFQNSPTIQQAEARLRGARATFNERRAGLFPNAQALGLAARTAIPLGDASSLLGGSASSAQTSSSSSPTSTGASSSVIYTNLYDAGFDATWEIDLFGGARREIESARDQAEARQAQLADSQVQLAAEVAQAYINLRDVQNRLELLQRSTELEQRQLDLTRRRRAIGTVSQADLDRLVTQLEQTRARLPQLQAQVEQYADEIATLVAVEPGQLDATLLHPDRVPLPPASVPVGDPTALLRRRPDIREAERELAANNAQIGQAIARFFPRVNLLGSVGFSSTDASKLFTGNSFTAFGGPSLSWTILDFGRTQAQVDEAKANRDEALARYRSTVLSALQDAETALSRYGHEREQVLRLTAASASAANAADLTQQRQRAGTASVIDALDVERQRLETEQNLAQAQAMLTNDFVSLQKALGLGWTAPGSANPADALRP
jgi:NodT family efflux transporter outer membrane factor (OMF) lipoprotein